MAVVLKNIFRIPKFFTHNFGFTSRCFSSETTQDAHNRLAVPFWSHNVKNFGNLRVFSENLGVHVTVSSSYGEESRIGLSLVSDYSDDLKEDLVAMREYICCNIAAEGDKSSHVTVFMYYIYYFI